LPKYYQTKGNKKFFQGTLDQLTRPGKVKKISGFIGRLTAKATTGDDIFISAVDDTRQSYQLEPAAVIKDYLGNVTFFKDYIDHINHVELLGGVAGNHSRVNRQEFYSWSPNICWDKFTNFQQYYWLPFGPDVVEIVSESSNSVDVINDILGKKNYTVTVSGVGDINLSNGMKVRFLGAVTPAEYALNDWYVEGVGVGIRLINEYDLEIRADYIPKSDIKFDDVPFDQLTFSETGAVPTEKDYITINRASLDLNPWTRGNRWFHEEVIIKSARAARRSPELDQKTRATRPIIEFKPDIKLYNHCTVSKKTVDVVDNFTTDVFSTVVGQQGYRIDGIDLVHGMRVLFTKDTDARVQNRIFRVNMVKVQPATRSMAFTPTTDIDVANQYIELFNEHGLATGDRIRYSVNNNLDAASNLVDGGIYYVQVIDQFTIKLFFDQGLTKQVELYRKSYGTHLFYLYAEEQQVINLIEEPDSIPTSFEGVSVRYGKIEQLSNGARGNQGQNYWFDGGTWRLSQRKTGINVPPLFDVFDQDGVSYADYPGSSFTGTKIFSYKIGSGATDSELGFPLSYKNIGNTGDILFEFNLAFDQMTYNDQSLISTKTTEVGFLKQSRSLDDFGFINGWVKSNTHHGQPIIRVFKESGLGDRFPIDVFNNINDLDDLEVRVFINGIRLNRVNIRGETQFSIESTPTSKTVVLVTPVSDKDVVTLKLFSKQPKNHNGYYELPINLQNNPLNQSITQFTLGEVVDHVITIIDSIDNHMDFRGTYPGVTNLRDLGAVSPYGTRFVQHSGPLNFALYHLGSKDANLFKAIEQARLDYSQFKKTFLITAENSGIDAPVKQHVDQILQIMAKDKRKDQPYYLSDMFGYTASNRLEIKVVDPRITAYSLSEPFSMSKLSNKAVNIYLNGVQLTHGRDYVFGDIDYFELLITPPQDSVIEVYEYVTTDGCYCPPTPTKLGIYPKFHPVKYLDTTYLTPTDVIRGHDGSVTVAFNDYRDDLILELETRIFNNIKVEYDPDIFDIYDFVPGVNRETDYSLSEFNTIMSSYFYQWAADITQDHTKHTVYDDTNAFTYNYRGAATVVGSPVPASWRGIYRWVFDCDAINVRPWECLGFSMEPQWWQGVYGPAPYTKNNHILWEDIIAGAVREPAKSLVIRTKFARPSLTIDMIPVSDSGELISPYDSGIVTGNFQMGNDGYFEFGDQEMVETAWRKSSNYPFALIQAVLLMSPCDLISKCFDRSRIVRNKNHQLVYSDTNLRLRMSDVVIPSVSSGVDRVNTSGLVNYVVEYLTGENVSGINRYQSDLTNLTNHISSRLGAFTSKEKFRLLLDSKTPKSSGGVFVPEENYQIEMNVSSAIQRIDYSGVMITKFADGFEIRGYTFDRPYFEYYTGRINDRVIRVGGISESYSNWTPGSTYVAGKIVSVNQQFYRVLVTHQGMDSFDPDYFVKLPELPVVGGREAILRKYWDRTSVKKLAYGTRLATIQEVVDFIQGYGVYLTDLGVKFDDFNADLQVVANWETSIKEFLFWSTQGWAEGSVISLSPAAHRLTFVSENSVVEDLLDPFYGYGVYRVDGQKLEPEFISVYRNNNTFVIEPDNTPHGIYAVSLYLVQKEHVAILDDTTLFNDTVYDKPAGYRQERIKVVGYTTVDWTGGFDIPGFVYDQAKIQEWAPWTDYRLGDVVKHTEFFYSAKEFVPGTEQFNSTSWLMLTDIPKSKLMPNLDYRAEQFTDFYDLDTDNFDSEQQRLAQHLIGYQRRQYLENIINNDVSQYKFYQGMILEKGTANVLSKLFDVLSADDQESLTFSEEWAVRVGEYGAVTEFEETEFVLNEWQFKINPQPLVVVTAIDQNDTDFLYQQLANGLYIAPQPARTNIWPKKSVRSYLEGVNTVVDRVDANSIKKAFLYNRATQQVVCYLDVVDAFQGKIPGVAEQELRFKTYFDPASYNYVTDTDHTVTTNTSDPWGSDQIGMLWWNLANAEFVDTSEGTVAFKAANWNKLADSASIDIYEWVSSTMMPSEWDSLSGTDQGEALGVSGTSLYGDSVYCTSGWYDKTMQRTVVTYYFWVKNKTTVPAVEGRVISAKNVADLITDPVGYGYPCLNFVDSNCVSLVNVKKYLQNNDVVLSVQHWIASRREINHHRQWKLIRESETTTIPKLIEEKWVDSLVGQDTQGRSVPNLELPVKLRYGIENRPRQSMFVNRIEALSQIITRVNRVLSETLIADYRDLTDLTSSEPYPSRASGVWGKEVDTADELTYLDTALLVKAELAPVIAGGKIIGATVVNPGYGYVGTRPATQENTWYGPTITVRGSGVDADIKTLVNSVGQVIDVVVVQSGEGYGVSTVLDVRPHSVLVKNNVSTGGWAIYSWNQDRSSWYISRSSGYNVTKYWEYIDWYGTYVNAFGVTTAYNQYVKIDYLLNNTFELITTNIPVGSVVKVKNAGAGGWELLRKVNDAPTVSYSENFVVIGKQNGTIRFLPSLYGVGTGFDEDLHDSGKYDPSPTAELRIIISTIKNKIFVDDLYIEYVKLFFASLRYALHEQLFTDWVFKTSFVRATHHVGNLVQKINYNNDNLEYFEDYVNEVKPYRTKIREYVSSYSNLEPADSVVTDFDVPVLINNELTVSTQQIKISDSGEITPSYSDLANTNTRQWSENVGFEITELSIVDAGSGYVARPSITFQGPQLSGGDPASAVAYISNGKVARVELISSGTRWSKAPNVVVVGEIKPGGRPARIVARVGNSLVRTSLVSMKFDRVDRAYRIPQLVATDIFSGSVVNGVRAQFSLRWGPCPTFETSQVKIDSIEVPRGSYFLSTKVTEVNGTTRYSGVVTLESPPKAGSVVEVKYYRRDIHFDAADRINFYYAPGPGQAGKDLSQLMTGVDYSGVEVSGIGLRTNYGWDSDKWSVDQWDPVVTEFSDGSSSVESQYDTKITGGDLWYKSATGVLPSEIVIDGDHLISVNNSHTPEEVVPARVMETLAIKTYMKGTEGCPMMLFRNYWADGDAKEFDIGQTFINSASVLVKVNDLIVQGYSIDQENNRVVFTETPTAGDQISIISMSSGEFTSPTSVAKIETIVYSGADEYLLVNPIGQSLPLDPNVLVRAGDRILTPPSFNYFTLSNGNLSYSITDARYSISDIDSSKVICYLDGEKLTQGVDYLLTINQPYPVYGGDSTNYLISGGTGYQVNDIIELISEQLYAPIQLIVTSVDASGSIADTTMIEPGKSYSSLLSEVSVRNVSDGSSGVGAVVDSMSMILVQDLPIATLTLTRAMYADGAQLIIGVTTGAEYLITDTNKIKIIDPLPIGQLIEIMSFYNHDLLGVQRQTIKFNSITTLLPETPERYEFDQSLGGVLTMSKPVLSGDYVWVIKNGHLLSKNVGYYLSSDQKTVVLNGYLTKDDRVQVMAFTGHRTTSRFGFMQFRDILNRTHYKRLSDGRATTLAQPLAIDSDVIVVEDGGVLEDPTLSANIPGIIEINGERIEYFLKDGNTLSRLYRGTLGTGAPDLHPAGSHVQSLGSRETIPYRDQLQVQHVISDGTTQLLPIIAESDEVEIYVGGRKLRKNAVAMFDESLEYPYSPVSEITQLTPGITSEGDRVLPAEFTVTDQGIVLYLTPSSGVKITVIRKTGALWNDLGQQLDLSTTRISQFISAGK